MKPVAALTALALLVTSLHSFAEQIVFSEVHYNPRGETPEYVEIFNNTSTPFDFANWRLSDGVDYTFPDYDESDAAAAILKHFERVIVTSGTEAEFRTAYPSTPAATRVYGPWTGALNNNGERIALEDKNGVLMVSLTYGDDGKWPVAADGAGHTLVVKDVFKLTDDWRNWKASSAKDGTPGSAPAGESGIAIDDPEVDLSSVVSYVDLGTTYKFNDTNTDLTGTDWTGLDYDDSAWSSGPGLFGFESRTLPDPGLQTALNRDSQADLITYYLRTEFDFNFSPNGSRIEVDVIVDDGARFFLNGKELGRLRLPDGDIGHATVAEKVPTEGIVEENVLAVDGSGFLVEGRNVFAVEVHNESSSSSDVVFGSNVRIKASNSGAVINEVLPAAAGFIEFYNPTLTEMNLRDHYISDDLENLQKTRIAQDLVIAPLGLSSIGFSEAGLTPNTNTKIYFSRPDGTTVLNAIDLNIALNGSSAGRKPTGGNSWFLFSDPTRDGSNIGAGDIGNLLSLNELHINEAGAVDWIELRNYNDTPLSLEGLFLSGNRDFSDKVALTGMIPGNGYASAAVQFSLTDNAITLYLVTSSDTVLRGRKFTRTAGQTVFQALPEGSNEWYGGSIASRDAKNAPVRETSIVINEIMYDPPSNQNYGEFIELHNKGAATVDLSGWTITDGVSFDFPNGTTLAAGEYLAIAANKSWMQSTYPGIRVLGNFTGRLRTGGELVRIEDAQNNLVDEVDYLPSGDWPELADGDGSSMELKHPDMNNDSPSAWADSDESEKAPMKSFTYTAEYVRPGFGAQTSGQEWQMHLVGDGHLIVENVSIKENGVGDNLVENPSVMSPDEGSGDGWVCQGTHWASFMDNGKLHLVADGHGDNKANRAEVDMGALSRNVSYTLTFDARWVNGKPRIIGQTLDHGFGSTFLLPIPNNLGTPGAPNSRLLTSVAPTVTKVLHSPAVPKSSDPVVISAYIGSDAALQSVEIVHREDTSSGDTPWLRTTMNDTGTAGDAAAGDGLYSASLTQYQDNETIVQFYVEAVAAGGGTTMLPKLGAERPALYIVDDRTMPDTLLRERFIISQYDRRALTAQGGRADYNYNFPRMSNHFFNATFIANESMIFYNAEIRKSGSPFTRDGGSALAHGKWKLPGDRLIRGRRRSVFDASGTSEGSGTPRFYDDRLARYFLYQLGHPINENEFVHWVVNDDNFKLRENHEPISNDFLNRNFEDGTDGTLLRVDDEWQFTSDNGDARQSRNADWSYKDSDNPVRYHSEWIMRSRETDYDYTNFIEFVRTLDANDFDEATINRMANRDMLCINAAVRGYDADWDTLTVNRGKNAYFYRPKSDGRWMLIHWDGDRVFEGSQPIIGGLRGIKTYFEKPYIERTLHYYLNELIRKHTKDSARTAAWMAAEEASTEGTGIRITTSHYERFFNTRERAVETFIRGPFDEEFAISTANGETTEDTFTLEGKSPSRVYTLRVVDHPEAVLTWDGLTDWKLSGIALKSGQNAIMVEGLTHQGEVLEQSEFTVTKTTNAVPIVAVNSSPNSLNVSVSESLVLDASSSFDPEGGTLTYAWAAPENLPSFTAAPSGRATATFSQPGIYTFTVTVTDSDGNNTVKSIEAAVYGRDGFSSFSDPILADFWELDNVELRDNFSPESYYTLDFRPGRLTLQILDDNAKPLGLPQAPLPDPLTYITLGQTWKYDDSGADLGIGYAAIGFDDSGWASGAGLFGFESRTLPDPGLQTTEPEFSRGNVTYYLRTEFQFDKDPLGSVITIDHILDDGARFFLNGVELGRTRLPAGEIDASTVADKVNIEGEVELAALSVDGSAALVAGTNVLAVEVHNESAGSSDLVFGMNLHIAARDISAGGNTNFDGTIHPWINRPLPATGEWALQTKVELETRQFGDFQAGLLVEAMEGATPVRYAIGLEDGNKLSVLRVTTSGAIGSLSSIPHIESKQAEVRIRRESTKLIFDWKQGNAWSELHQIDLAAGTTTVSGGPFSATEFPQSMQVSFDYVMLVNPSMVRSPLNEQLMISEFMYNPATGNSLEFIEFYNIGSTAIDLNGVSFLAGDPFDELSLPEVTLAPGAYGLIVSNQEAFLAAYGAQYANQIIGQWTGGNLANSGETITLVDSSGAIIHSFTYDDNAPWPEAADGTGASLVLVNPQAKPDHSSPASWRASSVAGGSPGNEDTSPDPGLLAFALGADLAGASPESLISVETTSSNGQEYVSFSYVRRIDAPGISYIIESSTNLQTWQAAPNIEAAGEVDNGNGTRTVTVQSTATVGNEKTRYLRLRVEQQ
ncbi:MAG: hypothetical protein ACI9R3_003874 [Verrucomicrobiales bacterium]|jgi:hypothetical protein